MTLLEQGKLYVLTRNCEEKYPTWYVSDNVATFKDLGSVIVPSDLLWKTEKYFNGVTSRMNVGVFCFECPFLVLRKGDNPTSYRYQIIQSSLKTGRCEIGYLMVTCEKDYQPLNPGGAIWKYGEKYHLLECIPTTDNPHHHEQWPYKT